MLSGPIQVFSSTAQPAGRAFVVEVVKKLGPKGMLSTDVTNIANVAEPAAAIFQEQPILLQRCVPGGWGTLKTVKNSDISNVHRAHGLRQGKPHEQVKTSLRLKPGQRPRVELPQTCGDFATPIPALLPVEELEPGTVVVINHEGALAQSQGPTTRR